MTRGCVPIRAAVLVAAVLLAAMPAATIGQEAGEILLSPAAPVAVENPSVPRTWGTSQISYYSVGAQSLVPQDSTTTYVFYQQGLRYATNTTALPFQAPLHLPSGARIVSLQLEGYDVSIAGEVKALLQVCTFDGQTCVPQTGLPICSDAIVTVCSGTPDAPGFATWYTDMTSANIVVDNYYSGYRVLAGMTTNDGSTAIGRVVVGYVLQVSPDPPFASFADVPVSHPFHQYVEALLQSQITAGCGGGNYCPDAPLTRGQMAVFLAKALGLQWQ
jgi:hypothetical protein